MNGLSAQIIGAAIEVHSALGPGLLESAYEAALCRELQLREIPFRRQHPLPLSYKGMRLDRGYRLDLLVDRRLPVELKAVDAINDIHIAQLLTYLRHGDFRLGLLLNFNVATMTAGIRHVANGYRP